MPESPPPAIIHTGFKVAENNADVAVEIFLTAAFGAEEPGAYELQEAGSSVTLVLGQIRAGTTLDPLTGTIPNENFHAVRSVTISGATLKNATWTAYPSNQEQYAHVQSSMIYSGPWNGANTPLDDETWEWSAYSLFGQLTYNHGELPPHTAEIRNGVIRTGLGEL